MDVKKEITQARPPNLISALLAGFDSITDHLGLLVLPVILDIFLWLGPRLRISDLLLQTLENLGVLTAPSVNQSSGLILAGQEFWRNAAQQINLFTALRSFPIGIPSLMAAEMPVQAPLSFAAIQIDSWPIAILLWLSFGLIGIIFGTLYFITTTQAALDGEINSASIFRIWPWTFTQIFILTIAWILVILLLSLPASFLLSLILSAGSIFGQILLLIAGGFILWIFFPLIFSAHGIFVYRLKARTSLRKSIQLVQMTLPTTALFVLALIVIDQGLGLLWRIPAENTWLLLIGVVGHAFVATGLLAASIIYYRDADRWIQALLRQFSNSKLA